MFVSNTTTVDSSESGPWVTVMSTVHANLQAGTHLHLNITVNYLGYTSQRRVEVCFEQHFPLLSVEKVRILYVVELG